MEGPRFARSRNRSPGRQNWAANENPLTTMFQMLEPTGIETVDPPTTVNVSEQLILRLNGTFKTAVPLAVPVFIVTFSVNENW